MQSHNPFSGAGGQAAGAGGQAAGAGGQAAGAGGQAARQPRTYTFASGTYTEEELDALIADLAKNGKVIPIRDDSPRMRLLIEGAQICLNAGASGDYGLMIDGATRFMGGLYVCYDLQPDSNPDTKGAPRQDGIVEATDSAVSILRDRAQVAQATRVAPDTLAELGRRCGYTIALASLCGVGQKFGTNITVPLSREIATDLREVGTYIEKDAAKDLDLSVQSEPLFSYLKDASKKGAKTKKKIKKVKGTVAKQTADEVGAQARTEARAQAEQQLTDVLGAYVKGASNK